jgi:hypothetical protein
VVLRALSGTRILMTTRAYLDGETSLSSLSRLPLSTVRFARRRGVVVGGHPHEMKPRESSLRLLLAELPSVIPSGLQQQRIPLAAGRQWVFGPARRGRIYWKLARDSGCWGSLSLGGCCASSRARSMQRERFRQPGQPSGSTRLTRASSTCQQRPHSHRKFVSSSAATATRFSDPHAGHASSGPTPCAGPLCLVRFTMTSLPPHPSKPRVSPRRSHGKRTMCSERTRTTHQSGGRQVASVRMRALGGRSQEMAATAERRSVVSLNLGHQPARHDVRLVEVHTPALTRVRPPDV